jgi:type IV pilus assembly protein PilM
MAENPTSIALSIGSQRISMAVFEAAKNGGIILKAYDSEVLTADPSMEAARSAQARVAIRELVGRLGVAKSKVRYAISGQAAFIRFVKLPPLEDDNIEQLVTFEAQQHVPFPLEEVVWDYELLESSGEKECVIVAIKTDALDEINSAVNEAGILTQEVDVSPLAIYNAYLASYGKPEESTLLIDIGAKNSNLLYMEGGRFFTRSIAIGGATITASIAKEYGVSYAEAELQKTTNGLVALGGGHTEQLDEAVAALAMVIRNALTRLPSEIARTTNYYRSQHGGSAPKRVIIAGGGALLPYTLEFFHEKLNLPVEFFNPLRSIAIGKKVDAERLQSEGLLIGDLVGLGLRSLGNTAVNIDLVPGVVEQARAHEKRRPFLITAAAALVIGCAAWAGLKFAAAGKAADELKTITETRESIEPIHRQITNLLKKEDQLRNNADRFTNLEADQTLWIDVLNELSGAFASDVLWLSDLEPLNQFDPKAADEKKARGTSVVTPQYPNSNYGTSPLARIQMPEAPQRQGGGGRNAKKPPAGPTINAVRITGYWRENPRGQNVVSELVQGLRERSEMFRFTTPDAKGNPVPLDEKQIIPEVRTVVIAEGDLAYRFQIVLPLAREIVLPREKSVP